MAQYDLNKATTTDFTNKVPDFIVESKSLDVSNDNGEETFVYFDKAPENFGYYFNHPQAASPINSLCTWAFGKGWEAEDKTMEVILKKIDGNGKDTFDSIIWNHEAVKLMVGDAFLEIVRNDKGTLVNLIPISPERMKVVYVNSRIKRYEVWNGKTWAKKKTTDILHSFNKRIGDQIHGTSLIQSNKTVIDTGIEAYEDERVIKHRDKALGIVYYKTDNTGKITFANTQIQNAVKNGEMVGMPEDTAKIEPYPSKSSEDRQNWLQYNENLGYQTGGVPRAIATSDGTSEVGGKMGHVIFEPIYGKEQIDMENELWQQAAIKIKFKRPPSLGGLVSETEQKNTGQTSIQPNDVTADLERE
jgi:hypothetical protein